MKPRTSQEICLKFEIRYEYADALEVPQLRFRLNNRNVIACAGLSAGLVCVAALFDMDAWHGQTPIERFQAVSVWLIVFAPLLMLGVLQRQRRQRRQRLRKWKWLVERLPTVVLTVSESGLSWESTGRKPTHIPWDEFRDFIETPAGFFLFSFQHRAPELIPKRVVPPDSMGELRHLLLKLRQSSTRTGGFPVIVDGVKKADDAIFAPAFEDLNEPSTPPSPRA